MLTSPNKGEDISASTCPLYSVRMQIPTPNIFWKEAQEVTLCMCVCDFVEFFTLSKRELLRLVYFFYSIRIMMMMMMIISVRTPAVPSPLPSLSGHNSRLYHANIITITTLMWTSRNNCVI